MEVLDLIASGDTGPEQEMLPTIIDRFTVHGPNGRHPCLITAPAMCSISGAKDASWNRLFRVSTARSLAVQLTRVVAYIHGRGTVHGDLHLGNVLLRLPSRLNGSSIDGLYKKYNPPSPEPVVRFDKQPLGPHVPKHAFSPTWLGQKSEEIPAEVNIILSDFGVAFAPSTETRQEPHTPIAFGPLEAHSDLRHVLSYPADVWTLGCALWEILGQRSLFDGFLVNEDDIPAEHIDTFGGFSPEWWGKWNKRSKYFQESGEPKEDRQVLSWDYLFERHIQKPRREVGIAEFDDNERAALMAMLRSIFRFRPEERVTIADVMQSEWIVQCALPDYEKSRTKA
ncbi:kinase-like domain-containing protein [Aspergillus keveii]|uniref:Kinase-like domain-containing protein n=1 Tax=Aspergillus keveii TaxID=714993 RepID=A0ABR4FLF6_9EURO